MGSSSTGTVELVQFIRPEELDPMYLDAPYYIGPDGPVAEEGFAVFREALRRTKRIGIGQVVLGGKDTLVVLKPLTKGLVLFTLRYATEVRAAAAYFEDLRQEPPDATQVALAQKLIESKSSALAPASFPARYRGGVRDLIKPKVDGPPRFLFPRSKVG